MVKLILEIKEEETVTFKNRSTLAVGINVAIKELGIDATEEEKKATEYIKGKIGIEEKIQFINESGRKNTVLEEFIKNLIK